MSRICPSCGGIVGRDCFNPEECAYITQQMNSQASSQEIHDSYQQGYNEGYHAAKNEPPSPEPPTDPDIVAEAAELYPYGEIDKGITCSLRDVLEASRKAHISCTRNYSERVRELEAEVEDKDAEIGSLKEQIKDLEELLRESYKRQY